MDRLDGMSILTVLQEALHFLHSVLMSTFHKSNGRGGFYKSWKAYQAELALEELIYGHPLSPEDRSLAVSLGTSPSCGKSITKMRGFLGLAPYSVTTSGVCCPALNKWTKDVTQKLQIQRVFLLCDSLGAAPFIVGAQLWMVWMGTCTGTLATSLWFY